MHITKEQVPIKIDVPGATAQQAEDFGVEEACSGNDLFHWPPGHSVRVTENAEVVLFSPQQEHTEVIDHMLKQMAAG